MLITRLKLENWKSIDSLEKRFTEGVNLIEGNNYSGKTSIIQALFFGLFKETMYKKRLKPDHLKQEGEQDSMVEIDFIMEDSKYRIRRFITGEKRISVNSHLYKINDQGEQVSELESVSRKTDYLQKLQEKIFKASRDYLKNINFIQEGSIYNFMIDPGFTINKDLSQILRLDDLTEISDFCDRGIKTLDHQIDDLEDQKDECEEVQKNTSEKKKELNTKLDEKKQRKADIKTLISQEEEKIELLEKLNDLREGKETLEENRDTELSKKNKVTEKIGEIEKKLQSISKKEKKLKELKSKITIYENNKKKLKNLREEKEDLQKGLAKLETKCDPLEDKKKELRKKTKKIKKQKEKIKDLPALKEKRDQLQDQTKGFEELQIRIKTLEEQIKDNKSIITDFEKGECPISHEPCPVAGDLIDQREKALQNLEEQKEKSDRQFSELQKLKEKYDKFNEHIQKKEDFKNKLDNYERRINKLSIEIKEIEQLIPEKKELETKIAEKKQQIENLETANKKLQGERDEYTQIQERLKDKEGLEEQLDAKNKELGKYKNQLNELQDKIEEKEKGIKRFKEQHIVDDSIDIKKKQKEIKKKRKKIQKIEKKEVKIETKMEQLDEKLQKTLKPFGTKEELEGKLHQMVHKKYKIKFFKASLQRTLKELKTRKLRQIRERCNEAWQKLKGHSGMDSIEWDEDFIPQVTINGETRSLYQLSASERMLVYFAIRASLLGELGPHQFLVVDNLLGPFMKDNQDNLLQIIEDFIKKTDIKQIIFTGFDIDNSFTCENRISINKFHKIDK